jgi:hypothetical protein
MTARTLTLWDRPKRWAWARLKAPLIHTASYKYAPSDF